jgi:hypothetical protein
MIMIMMIMMIMIMMMMMMIIIIIIIICRCAAPQRGVAAPAGIPDFLSLLLSIYSNLF